MPSIPASLDRVAPRFGLRGAWQTSTAYVAFDRVENDGSAYVAIADHTSGAGTEPGVGADWETVWVLDCAKGETGDTGPTGPEGPAGEGGGSSWYAGTSAGMSSCDTDGTDLATLPLPDGWLATGAALEWVANVLHGLNAGGVDIAFDLELRKADDTVVATVHDGTSWTAPSPGTGLVLGGRIEIADVGDIEAALFVASSESKGNVTRSGEVQGYITPGAPLTGATKLVLVGTSSSSTLSANGFSISGLDVTPT